MKGLLTQCILGNFQYFNVSDQIWQFDMKMTKKIKNYMVNMIMNVLGTVCQLIHYFPSK